MTISRHILYIIIFYFTQKQFEDKNFHFLEPKKKSLVPHKYNGTEMELLPALLDDRGLENVDHLVVNFYVKPGKHVLQTSMIKNF